jgi:2-hydroxychromene-2-carboxylate isomerase
MARIAFWYEFASLYSYPAAMRIERLAEAAGLEVEWHPFLLGPVFQRQGFADTPVNLFPDKGRYVWRDIERVCAAEGLPWRRPSAFPRSGLLAARIALLAREEGWVAPFTRAVYRANFVEDRDIASAQVIGSILDALERPALALLERAGSPEVKARLRAETDRAMAHGIFGAPSMVVGEELFWGNDRLEQALDWARRAAA